MIDEVLIAEDELQSRIKELGKKITEYYDEDDEVIMVCILRGGFFFMADLSRQVDLPVVLDFMDVTSYEGGTSSTGNVRIIKDLEESIEGKHVLIAEDIIDTGLTLKHVIKMLETRKPESIKICTLLDKPARRTEKEVEVDWNGFEIPNKFVMGYGLDYQEKYRNIPYIFVPKPELYRDK
ncbi:hypoxanthine phosphoribosyltransferase [Halanaerocella petrolearia]